VRLCPKPASLKDSGPVILKSYYRYEDGSVRITNYGRFDNAELARNYIHNLTSGPPCFDTHVFRMFRTS
jgi:hypothetical protein